MFSPGMTIVYNQSVHCDQWNFRKKTKYFWDHVIPSLLTTALVCTTTKNGPLYKFIPLDSHHHHHESGSLPIVGWETWLTTPSLACHINRRIPSCAIQFTSRILNHGSPLHNVQFVNCAPNVPGYYMYVFVYETGA